MVKGGSTYAIMKVKYFRAIQLLRPGESPPGYSSLTAVLCAMRLQVMADFATLLPKIVATELEGRELSGVLVPTGDGLHPACCSGEQRGGS